LTLKLRQAICAGKNLTDGNGWKKAGAARADDLPPHYTWEKSCTTEMPKKKKTALDRAKTEFDRTAAAPAPWLGIPQTTIEALKDKLNRNVSFLGAWWPLGYVSGI